MAAVEIIIAGTSLSQGEEENLRAKGEAGDPVFCLEERGKKKKKKRGGRGRGKGLGPRCFSPPIEKGEEKKTLPNSVLKKLVQEGSPCS